MEAPGKLNGMGTWRRYKLGQAQFTSWLKQTAEKLVTRKTESDETAKTDADAAAQQSRRQKKKAKAAATAGISFDSGTDKFVHWSQLEVLAQRVVDHAKPEDVPESAVNILRDVVGLRRKSFTFFSSAAKDTTDEKLKQSNASHAHIISVLERVLAKLEALVKTGRSRRSTNEPKDSSRVTTSDLSNMFAYLDLQGAPDAVDDTAAADDESDKEATPSGAHERPQRGGKKKGGEKGQKPKKPERQPEQRVAKASGGGGASWVDKFRFGLPGEEDEEEEDEFDLYMMVYCFFEDFNTIRNHVTERWCDYWFDRSVPLDTLAVITNAAFELFHQLEDDLVNELRPLNPELAQYDFMMSMLFYHYGIDHVDYDSYDYLDKDETDERIWKDESDWLALPSYFTLQQVLEIIPPGKVPMMAPSQRRPDVYGANTLEGWKSFQLRVLNQIVTEGAHLKALKTNQLEPPVLPIESRLLLDFQESLKWRNYSSAIIFSLHLWVDIRNIIETDHDAPFHELQTTATKLKQALEAHNPIKYHKDHDFKRRWIARIWETKHYMVEDFLFEDKQARFRQLGIEEDPDSFFLLKNEPVWAGLLDFRARLVYSQLGHDFVTLSSIVDAAACLYHAALATDRSLPPWEEMGKYVSIYADDCRFKLELEDAHGAAAIIRNFAGRPCGKGEQQRRVAFINGEEQTFIPAIGVRQSLYQRYAFDDQKQVALVDYLEGLSSQRLQIGDSAREGVPNTRALMGPNQSDDTGGDGNSNGDAMALVKRSSGVTHAARKTEKEAQRKTKLAQLSPIEMLQLLDDTVTSQVEGLLTLDFFKLFDESVALLKAVVAECGPEMESRLGPRDGDLPTWLERLPNVLSEDLETPPKQTEMLETVVKGYREFFRSKEAAPPLSSSFS
ncbi:hypothetical protein C8A00DRAFT_35011 [Chaetomidium leptoderma]|uniref:DUF6604 domain-containing protein n=1 Tax=Chaetomidium leptoderma TaxID=669021 RepID=A0AAN6ZVC9_9PEZI|nr:hypothetical protein C8A00DRAFT_35011 [Chaetomidium leptoderma]